MIAAACIDCGQTRKIKARHACRPCYQLRFANGTLGELPLVREPNQVGTASESIGDGLTYRRLDYWTTRGYLIADRQNPGSGRFRTWSEDERAIAAMIVKLTAAGLTLEAAAAVARAGGVHELAPGIKVEVAA